MIASLLETYLKGVHAESILDVGPGWSDFAQTVAQVTGARRICYVDYNQEVLNYQSAQARRSGCQVEIVRSFLTPEGIGGMSGTYDVILCQEVLEHLRNAEQTLIALADKLSPQGRMVITVPTKCSERWLKLINPAYMRDEPFGHVREYDRKELHAMFSLAGLVPLVFLCTQPHYFLSHTWLYGTRVKIDGSTGKILSSGLRTSINGYIHALSLRLFLVTGMRFWGYVFPRNYFIVALRRVGPAIHG